MFIYSFRTNFNGDKLEFETLKEAVDKAIDHIMNSSSFPESIVDTKLNKIVRDSSDIANLYRERYHKSKYVPAPKFKSKIKVKYTLEFERTIPTNDMKKSLEELSKKNKFDDVDLIDRSFKLIESQELFNLF